MRVALHGPRDAISHINRDVGGVVGHVDDSGVSGTASRQDLPVPRLRIGMSRDAWESAEQRYGEGNQCYEQTSVRNEHGASFQMDECLRQSA